jgi:hypothetical protein
MAESPSVSKAGTIPAAQSGMTAACESIPLNVRDLIYESRCSHASVRAVAALLPASDEELGVWLTESIAANDQPLVMFLALAAGCAERALAAEHLARGLPLLGNDNLIGWFVCHASGEVDKAVMQAVEHLVLAPSNLAHALLPSRFGARNIARASGPMVCSRRRASWPAIKRSTRKQNERSSRLPSSPETRLCDRFSVRS